LKIFERKLQLDVSILVGGKNVMDADNQQERLIKLGWVIGFVDGEGCFCVGFVKQSDCFKRKGYKTGYQVSHEFAVTQGVHLTRDGLIKIAKITQTMNRKKSRASLIRILRDYTLDP
jgi:hypothetical protein